MMKQILVVDDNAANLNVVNGMLRDSYKVYPVDSGEVALKFLRKQRPDLILLDVDMPAMSGIELERIIKSNESLSSIPIIFLTGMTDLENEARAFELGAVDYIHKPVNKTILMARVKLHLELESYRKHLEELVEARTGQVLLLQKIVIDLLGCVTEFRDKETGDHVERTSKYAKEIMDSMAQQELPPEYAISADYYEDIIKSTPLHDIGKISIPDAILLKPARLTSEEFEIMKTHVDSGGKLLRRAIEEYNGPSFLDTALEIVMTHHEKWNGMGYPNKLANTAIPLSGRIMALADVYDALTSKRPYKEPFSHKDALEIIVDNRGSHFDPILTDVFLGIQDRIMEIADHYTGTE